LSSVSYAPVAEGCSFGRLKGALADTLGADPEPIACLSALPAVAC